MFNPEHINNPAFWQGFLMGSLVSARKKRELISESKAAEIAPGVSSAKEFRTVYVMGDEQFIQPIRPPHTTRLYYYSDEVEALADKFRKVFDRKTYLADKRKKQHRSQKF